MANKNIQMKHSNNGTWDLLFPITLTNNVIDSNGLTIEQKISDIKERIDNIENVDLTKIKEDIIKVENDFKKINTDVIKNKGDIEGLTTSLNNLVTNVNSIDNRLIEIEKYVFVGGHNLIAIGDNSMASRTDDTKNSIAIGRNALLDNVFGRYNLALGNSALRHVQGEEGTNKGSRNTGIGDNTMMFSVNARSNVAMGRNALATNVEPELNVAIGGSSMAGYAPLDLDQETIVNNTPTTAKENTSVGSESLQFSNGNLNTAIGRRAGWQIKNGTRNTALGSEAMSNADNNQHIDGNQKELVNMTGTYTISGKTITINITNHTVKKDDLVLISPNSIEASFNTVSSVTNVNTFTVVSRVSISNLPSTGSIKMTEIVRNNTSYKGGSDNTAVGFRALFSAKGSNNNTGVGGFALRDTTGDGNVSVGYLSSLTNKGNNNTALGHGALRYLIDGSDAVNINNSTAIGYNSRVSGSNQMQLGTSDIDVYTYKPISERSDKRDKKEIRDTILGLDFINRLKPVDFKWKTRDGLNNGERYHHGFIAQDIESVINETGIDFGGFQDHKIKGECDILTVSYNELLAPIVKSIQEMTSYINKLEKKVDKLEKR